MRNQQVVRIGAVSYLNTLPLVEGLAEEPHLELSFDLPSRLADQLAAGDLDVGLIPCIEFFQNPEYTIVSDACIGCRGPVWSVKLLSRVPFPDIRSLALDEGSRTSAALVRILLRQRHQLSPTLYDLPMGAAADEAATDAVLIIGDRAMHTERFEPAFPYQWDLGEQWREWSGLSFVFAMWVARPNAGDAELLETALGAARDRGLTRLEQLARQHAARFELTPRAVLTLLARQPVFSLGTAGASGTPPLSRVGSRVFLGAFGDRAAMARRRPLADP